MYIEILEDSKKPKYGRKDITFGFSDSDTIGLFENGEKHIGTIYPVRGYSALRLEIDEVIRTPRVSSIRSFDEKNPGDLELMKLALKNDYGLNEDEYMII